MIETLSGAPASKLGLAAYPRQDPKCVCRAADRGINYFFFYSPGHREFVDALAPLVCRAREDIIVATGSGARKRAGLRTARRKSLTALGVDAVDVFFSEYIHPADDPEAIFGDGGVLDELTQWKADGTIRYVGATAHDRTLARRLAADSRVDVLMHRYNMAHRKASREVFPTAIETRTPVIAFTATRWGSLLERHDAWSGDPPTAADCYRFCLAQPAVRVALTAPKTIGELSANLSACNGPPMSAASLAHWEAFGDAVYGSGGDRFETEWP